MSDNIIVWVQVKEQGASSAGMFRAKVRQRICSNVSQNAFKTKVKK